MRLLHYSAEPFTFDPARKYDGERGGAYKPHGFWLSAESDDDQGWRGWCEGENWRVDGLKHVYEVTLKPEANVLLIETLEELDAFNKRHGTPDKYDAMGLRWHEVYPLYDGIIIAPYQWERRHGFMWYYGWDCASGVIWNLSAIKEVRPQLPQRSEEKS